MPKITLVQYPGLTREQSLSPPCRKVALALRFKRLPFEIKNVGTPGQARRYNPRGRVPTLLIDDEKIVDSTDILTALDARFPEPSLMPRDEKDHAPVKILEDWADEVIYFHSIWLRWCVPENRRRLASVVFSREYPRPINSLVAWLGGREVARRCDGQGVGLKGEAVVRRELSECFDALEAILAESRFLIGETCTRADIAVYSVIETIRVPELTPQIAQDIDRRLELATWCDRVRTATDPTAPPGSGGPPDSSGQLDVPPGAGVMAQG